MYLNPTAFGVSYDLQPGDVGQEDRVLVHVVETPRIQDERLVPPECHWLSHADKAYAHADPVLARRVRVAVSARTTHPVVVPHMDAFGGVRGVGVPGGARGDAAWRGDLPRVAKAVRAEIDFHGAGHAPLDALALGPVADHRAGSFPPQVDASTLAAQHEDAIEKTTWDRSRLSRRDSPESPLNPGRDTTDAPMRDALWRGGSTIRMRHGAVADDGLVGLADCGSIGECDRERSASRLSVTHSKSVAGSERTY